MKYIISRKNLINTPLAGSVQFDTLEECGAWLTITPNLEPTDYVIVDTETNEWFDGYTLTHPPVNYKSLFSYSLA